jgi:hypothetical protein
MVEGLFFLAQYQGDSARDDFDDFDSFDEPMPPRRLPGKLTKYSFEHLNLKLTFLLQSVLL